MTDEQRIELEALITERDGMLAANKDREHQGYAQAYHEDCFDDLAAKIRSLAEQPADPDTDWKARAEAAEAKCAELTNAYTAHDAVLRTRTTELAIQRNKARCAADALAKCFSKEQILSALKAYNAEVQDR